MPRRRVYNHDPLTERQSNLVLCLAADLARRLFYASPTNEEPRVGDLVVKLTADALMDPDALAWVVGVACAADGRWAYVVRSLRTDEIMRWESSTLVSIVAASPMMLSTLQDERLFGRPVVTMPV